MYLNRVADGKRVHFVTVATMICVWGILVFDIHREFDLGLELTSIMKRLFTIQRCMSVERGPIQVANYNNVFKHLHI